VINKVGIYYAYWTQDWDADFVPYLSKVKELGFDVLEVNAGTIASLNASERGRLRDASLRTGISMSCCIGLPPSSDIADSSPTTRRAGIAHLGRIAEAMAECGIDRLGGIIYSCWPGSAEGRQATKEQALRWSIASMHEAIKKAEDLHLIYNVEVVNRFEQFLLNTAEEAVAYVAEVGSPNLKILLDTYHMNIEEDSFAQAIATAGTHLGHLHIGESNRKPPGRGHIPWQEIGTALKAIGFKDWVVMEPFLKPGGEVGRDIRVHRDLMPLADLDEEARRSCAFIRRLLA
jgi:D-psicose/D-tagatose/L-ribulose 3-epimerase